MYTWPKQKGELILLTGGPASIVWWTSTSIGRRAVLRQDDFTFLKLFLGTSEYWNKMHTNATACLTEKNSHLFLCLYDFVHKKEHNSQKLNKNRCLHWYCASVDQNQKYAFDFSLYTSWQPYWIVPMSATRGFTRYSLKCYKMTW